MNFELSQKSVLEMLGSTKKPTLFVLDKAQHLGDVLKTNFNTFTTTKILDHIHNGQLNNPLVLVGGGIGMAEKIFEKLGISGFDDACAFDLERLDDVFRETNSSRLDLSRREHREKH